MTSIAEFTIPAVAFPLGRIFEDRPEATLELDRVVPSGDTVMPHFWVRDPNGELTEVLEILDDLPELRTAVLMEDLGKKGLFRAEWKPEHMGIMAAIPAAGVTVLSASGSADGWTFELRATEVGQFSDFQQYCADHDIDVTLTRLSRLSEMSTDAEYEITPGQREALTLAYNEGYYDEPSETDQEALASQLGITRQALSSRLRRGYRNLIGNTIVPGQRDGE